MIFICCFVFIFRLQQTNKRTKEQTNKRNNKAISLNSFCSLLWIPFMVWLSAKSNHLIKTAKLRLYFCPPSNNSKPTTKGYPMKPVWVGTSLISPGSGTIIEKLKASPSSFQFNFPHSFKFNPKNIVILGHENFSKSWRSRSCIYGLTAYHLCTCFKMEDTS